MEGFSHSPSSGPALSDSRQEHVDLSRSVSFQESRPPQNRCSQWMAAASVSVLSLSCGMAVTWLAPELPVLEGHADVGSWAGNWTQQFLFPEALSTSQGAFLVSILGLGGVVGVIPVGFVAERVGRRHTLLGMGLILVFSWMLFLIAGLCDAFWLMLVARFIQGLATCSSSMLVPVYCNEVAEVSVRGTFGSLWELCSCVGILVVLLLSFFMPYALVVLTSSVFPLIFVVTFYFMPESPVHLSRVGRRQDALRALAWLRPGWGPRALDKELATLTAQEIPDSTDEKTEFGIAFEKVYNIWGIKFTTRQIKAVFIVYSISLLQQTSGISVMDGYSTTVFQQVGGSLSPSVASALLGVARVVAVMVAALTVDRVGRRPLLVCSSAVVCASLVTLAVVHSASAPWMPPVALAVYIFAFECGLGPVPWFITAELVGPAARAGAVTLAWGAAAVVCMAYPPAAEAFGPQPVFAGFAVMAALAMLFSLLLVPETRGKTRAQLRREMKSWPRKAPAALPAFAHHRLQDLKVMESVNAQDILKE